MGKGLILGFGTNQTRESVAVFLKSARAHHGPEVADVALITNRQEGLEDILQASSALAFSTTSTYSRSTGKYAKLLNRIVLQGLRGLAVLGALRRAPEIRQAYDVLLETWHHPQLGRWFAYQRILDFVSGYDWVVLSDVKDVVFQASLVGSPGLQGVTVYEDGESFAEGWNKRWYIQAYGQRAFDRVAARQPICIGVICGEIEPMRRMVRDFAAQIARSPFGKIEQAIFNQMIFEGGFDPVPRIAANHAAEVSTLAGPDVRSATQLRDGTICRSSDGTVLPIVHMYDRIKDYEPVILSKYL